MTDTVIKDMAICFVFFNPAKSKRMVMNYFYARSQHELQGFPIFTLELVYEGRKPEIPGAIHLKTKSYMFHKENLYHVLLHRIPKQYTKIACLDADVFFKDFTWYEKASNMLNTHSIVQPYENAYWLDLTYTQIIFRKKSTILKPSHKPFTKYHPGFAWCIQREWFETNGFFEYALVGSGDGVSYMAWLNQELPEFLTQESQCIIPLYEEFRKKIQPPTINFLRNMDIFHLYHGSRKNRQYIQRYDILKKETDIKNLIYRNEDGIFEWKDPAKWNPLFITYFQSRKDDDLSTEEKSVC